MRKIILSATGFLVVVFLMLQPLQANDEEGLENRIKGWFAAVNSGDYRTCLEYVAPFQFTGSRGLARMELGGGEKLLLFSGTKLFPLSKYQIEEIEFFDFGNESIVTINAEVIRQRKPLYVKDSDTGAVKGVDVFVYPARMTHRWVLLNGTWFIESVTMIQYLG